MKHDLTFILKSLGKGGDGDLASVITELQADAIEDAVPIETVLKKAKLVAVKLDYPEFVAWSDRELDGYKSGDDKPPYREVHGVIKARVQGELMPIFFKGEEDSKISNSPRWVGTPAGQIERMHKSMDLDALLTMPLPEDSVRRLFSRLNYEPTEILWVIDKGSAAAIVSAVRKVIFDWSLKLEQAGIHGNGISFDELAQRKAHEPSVVNSVGRVENFYGVMGNASGSNSSIHLTQTISLNDLNLTDARSIVAQIGDVLDKLKVSPKDRQDISNNLGTLSTEIESDSPDQSKIRAGFKSILQIVSQGTKKAAKDIIAVAVTSGIKTLIGAA